MFGDEGGAGEGELGPGVEDFGGLVWEGCVRRCLEGGGEEEWGRRSLPRVQGDLVIAL